LLRYSGAILAGVLKARALLLYPIFKPWNLSGGYKYFERAGEPIEWPYARTLDGGKIHVQAMVLEGDALIKAAAEAGQYGFEMLDDGKRLRFNLPFAISSKRIDDRKRAREIADSPSTDRKLVAA